MSAKAPSAGLVSGFLLRLARESIPRTQEGLAEDLGVDVGTVQGWESGRRPLTHTRAGDYLDLRRRLALLGADPMLLAHSGAALDADRILAAVLDPPAETDRHPLAGWVQPRDSALLVAWALHGTPPPALANLASRPRRGPARRGPLLPAADRARSFTNLRTTAERATADDHGRLLHRQALYLASYDTAPDAAAWSEQALRGMRPALGRRGYSPRSIEARTVATVAARQGDPDQLRHFISTALLDDEHGELANLAYWALWLGAMPADQSDDTFMHRPDPATWDPIRLFRALVGSFHLAPGTVDLYIHSISTLLHLHPWLPHAAPDAARVFGAFTAELLDGSLISATSRRDLDRLRYGRDDG
ncbi:helix-turn-helix domain-containing protein [Kitasatospora sp. NPDC088783]|uniref:helix-turn-helix domain-containing protein n=1 Tax=Kitasatospora sp. NPDC088783 TaxID=3364077 RepID=UPI003825CD4C